MNLSGLFSVEFRRLFLSKRLWAVSFFCLCGPLAGYKWIRFSAADMLLGRYIANPVLAGTVIGGLLWALFALYESNRLHKAQMDELSKAVVTPLQLALSRTLALLTLSFFTCILCGFIYLPYTINTLNEMFDLKVYAASFFIFMMPAWIISILISCALYQITARTDTAALIYTLFVFMNAGNFFKGDYFLQWLLPLVVSFSDAYSNITPLRIGLYTRIMWLFLSIGLFIFSFFCIRRYQKNLTDSFAFNIRRPFSLLLSAVFLLAGILMWINQPFISRGLYRFDSGFANESGYKTDTSVKNASLKLSFDTTPGIVNGVIQYTITESDGKLEDYFYLNAGYKILRITLNGEGIPYTTEKRVTNGVRKTIFTLPPSARNQSLVIEYKGYISNPRYLGSYIIDEVSSGFIQLMMNGNSIPWNPSFIFDKECSEDSDSYSIELTLPRSLVPMINYTVMSEFTDNADGSRTWKNETEKFNYNNVELNITAARFETVYFNAADMNIAFVFSEKLKENIIKYDIPAAIADVLNFGTEHIGKLPFSGSGGNLTMLVHSGISGGYGFALPGVIQWPEQSFSPVNLDDAFAGANAAELFVHEVIHLWWGMTVPCEDDGLWSNEGLTVYMTYRYMKEKYGELYANLYYTDNWRAMTDAQKRSFYIRKPEYLEKLPAAYRSLIEDINNINRYHKMPLMILEIEKLIGSQKLDEILQNATAKHLEYSFDNLFTFNNFLDACGIKMEDINLE
ncbi:MAG: hypothetical protein FWC17_01080 [Treponema sp.]|nr:hypothetical protein [Treponema sp.]